MALPLHEVQCNITYTKHTSLHNMLQRRNTEEEYVTLFPVLDLRFLRQAFNVKGRMSTAVSAETLNNSQNSTQHLPESLSFSLFSVLLVDESTFYQ